MEAPTAGSRSSLPTGDHAWTRGRPLSLEGVVVTRQGAMILDELEMRFEPGNRYVVVGSSGAGKSTLLRLLNRLEDPRSGTVRIGEDDLRRLPIRAVRSNVGLVFQNPRPLPGTVAENLAYPFLVRGRTPPADELLAAALDEFGLEARWLKRDASGLSGGERQRLGLAVALAVSPEILALDEPTSALDPASARKVADRLAERAEATGLRTIAVTHHRGHAPVLGDTAVVLERGRVVEVGPVASVLQRVDSGVWEAGE
jgi:putative ABC transport system ATP-binding protein